MSESEKKQHPEVRNELGVLSVSITSSASSIAGIGLLLDTLIGIIYTNDGHTGASIYLQDTSGPSRGGGKSTRTPGTPKKIYSEVIDRRLPHVNILFERTAIGRCTISVVFINVKKKMFVEDISVRDFKIIIDNLTIYV